MDSATTETKEKQEYENPVTTVDKILYAIAGDYPDNPQVRDVLAHAADRLLSQALGYQTDRRESGGVGLSPTFSEDNLERLGDRGSEEIVRKILQKLGIQATLEEIKQSPGWFLNSISVSLGDVPRVVEKTDTGDPGLHYTGSDPLLKLVKAPGHGWRIGVFMPSKAFDASLIHPIAKSSFPAEDISVPYLTPRSHS